ncbi:tRNA lysidine(34) synthetase TilS [Liquorilactobacillus satsumensis]|nr:tRNA lysidine(34) synthetase TilS [Liquorilactobacillus satsumensis]MCP9329718.1 tRNA lysidine(34) synthetase TilS [Liquorilactobacillus satsumensis]
MDLKREFTQYFKKISHSSKVLVAVSTGVDSMTLLDLLLQLPTSVRPRIYVAYIDHQLRQESRQEREFIVEFCKQKGLPLFSAVWPLSEHPQNGVEEAARNFRYTFFQKILKQNAISELLTAHHADDQAETFLMKLIRGGELGQLCAIRQKRSFATNFWLIRPLLPFSKNLIREYAQKRQLSFFEDRTNQTNAFLRNRLRHQVVPLLKKENPRFLEHINAYTAQLAEVCIVAQHVIAKQVNQLKNVTGSYSLQGWKELTTAEQTMVLRQIISSHNYHASERQLEQAGALLLNDAKPQGWIQLQKALFLKKEYTTFTISPTQNVTVEASVFNSQLNLGEWTRLPHGAEIGLFESTAGIEAVSGEQRFYFSKRAFLPLTVRHRLPGDKLPTRVGKQKIKKIFIEKKIPLQERNKKWIVAASSGLPLWIVGVRQSDLSEQKVNDKMQYMVIFRNITEK